MEMARRDKVLWPNTEFAALGSFCQDTVGVIRENPPVLGWNVARWQLRPVGRAIHAQPAWWRRWGLSREERLEQGGRKAKPLSPPDAVAMLGPIFKLLIQNLYWHYKRCLILSTGRLQNNCIHFGVVVVVVVLFLRNPEEEMLRSPWASIPVYDPKVGSSFQHHLGKPSYLIWGL